MKKILLIATGGTIASHAGSEGLIPEIQAEGLLKCVPEVFDICQPSAIQIYNIDSTNVTPNHWVELAKTIRENYDKYDGVRISEFIEDNLSAEKISERLDKIFNACINKD